MGANVGRRLHGEEHVPEVLVIVEQGAVELKNFFLNIIIIFNKIHFILIFNKILNFYT
jgi:hypothetical protein